MLIPDDARIARALGTSVEAYQQQQRKYAENVERIVSQMSTFALENDVQLSHIERDPDTCHQAIFTPNEETSHDH